MSDWQEKIAEDFAVKILKQTDCDEDIEQIFNEAEDMAKRAAKGWWEIPGKPYFNERMARIRERIKWGI